jgi:hypothetical protein
MSSLFLRNFTTDDTDDTDGGKAQRDCGLALRIFKGPCYFIVL